ncbi:MAG: GNAT family N-acetyltransferase [Flavobacteriia bacterium]|nr:GNAT family N-acetyltransferase [Flavobacteriia bacterium]OIP45184.1 MAG: GNAT family N-acetyltransferase [Flavobacteriaceae bacterium CG2_30_31_66]PIV97566.1 MAG: GNAT family N-acetyltransferase [Flavobacteriaceae bacterium CG17_big_fil_post_rev_8_21_14_2_50_31_13]PIX12625.1 MAG: GNAT family N-acetyltransferase [Flavobacteriaceae bacterium CG_4_8_14_3_um_filter_31_8]PIY14685.1 MAG: GNAT family N-acetyltransferase [Flavobacteriaceae bacterium CG_4_10_14_3_um_filter_31_253]PIZ10084.1 MAG: GN
MNIRKATFDDIPNILEIIDDAKALLKSLQIDQWQNGYPNKTQIENDIKNNESYVVLNTENQIIATTMFSITGEPTYKIIEGNWVIPETEKYGVIHRLATKKEFRKLGIAQFVFDYFHAFLKEQNIQSLKIDTHQENQGMQSLVKRLGYQYCGIIKTSYGDKRLAFEKIIQ